MKTRLLIVLGVALVALLVWRSAFSVNETEVALRTRFGQIEGAEYAAGLHWKWPLDEVRVFDRRVVTRAYPGEDFLSSDQKAMSVDFYVKWRVVDAQRYWQSTGGDEDRTASRLADIVRDHIKSAVAGAALSKVIADPHATLNAAAFADARSAAGEFGVQLVDIQLQRVDLTDDVANAVYQRMQQTLVAQAQESRAGGAAEAEKIRSDAERKRAEILADATRESQRLRGDADFQAAQAYARAYGHNPEFAAFYRSLQAYKATLGREGDILVLLPEGEFFKYLHSASGR